VDYLRWAELCRAVIDVFVGRYGVEPTGQQFLAIEREVCARRHEESLVRPPPPLSPPSREGVVCQRASNTVEQLPLVIWLYGTEPESVERQVPLGAGTPYFIRDEITGSQANAIRAMEGDC
jgi:hypothetical protein